MSLSHLASIFLLLLGTGSVLAESKGSPRIVGGTQATAGQFPHQVSLARHHYHVCGGSLISKDYVLTAAHCVNNGSGAGDLSCILGAVLLSNRNQIRKVAAVHVHPKYKGNDYDVALLRLSRPADLNANTKVIELASEDPPSGASVYISGWGAISNSGPISNHLLYGQVRYLDRNTCKRQYLPRLSDTTMCLVHDANKGACYGDSGGPATYKGKLVGVASFVIGRCGRAAPDGYERVSQLRQWIRETAKI